MSEQEFTELHWVRWEQWYATTPVERWSYSHVVLWPKYLGLSGRLALDAEKHAATVDQSDG